MTCLGRGPELQLLQTAAADVLAPEDVDVPRAAAEKAGGLVLAQDQGRALGDDFYRVPAGEAQSAAHLGGQGNAARSVHFSDSAKDFHGFCLSPFDQFKNRWNK